MSTRKIDEHQQPTPLALPLTNEQVTTYADRTLLVRIHDLEARNLDLHNQNEVLRAAKPMTAEHWLALEKTKQEHTKLFSEQEKVIVWLRENQPSLFRNERYVGLSFSQLIIHLLGGSGPVENPGWWKVFCDSIVKSRIGK